MIGPEDHFACWVLKRTGGRWLNEVLPKYGVGWLILVALSEPEKALEFVFPVAWNEMEVEMRDSFWKAKRLAVKASLLSFSPAQREATASRSPVPPVCPDENTRERAAKGKS